MAQKIEVKTLDDITGDEGAVTTQFALDGVDYEIDLSEENAKRLEAALADYISNARRVSGRRRAAGSAKATAVAKTSAPQGSSVQDKELRAAVRSWAKAEGDKLGVTIVGDRGRIRDDVMTAYEAQDVTLTAAYQSYVGEETRDAPASSDPLFSGV